MDLSNAKFKRGATDATRAVDYYRQLRASGTITNDDVANISDRTT